MGKLIIFPLPILKSNFDNFQCIDLKNPQMFTSVYFAGEVAEFFLKIFFKNFAFDYLL